MDDDGEMHYTPRRRRKKRQPPPQLVDKLIQNDVTDFCAQAPRKELNTVPVGFKSCNHQQGTMLADINSRSMLFVRRENVPLVVKCEVNGMEVCALVDTAMSVTTVSMDVIEKLRLTSQISAPTEYIFAPFTKSVVEAFGVLDDMDVSIGNFHQLITCYVVDSQQPEVVLGLDFLEETQAILDFESACLRVGGNHSVKLPFLSVHDIMRLARKTAFCDSSSRCPSL